jgi:hypothetical protein
MLKKFIAVPALAASLIGGAGAIGATAAPAAAQYVPPGYYYYNGPRQAQVVGIITSFYQFNMTLHARSGAFVPVQLHQGTVLVPLGLTLRPGMPVIVHGYWRNGAFYANRIRLL